MFKIKERKEVVAMYGNNYPNDYENRNVVDSTARDVKPETGNFSGQSAPVHICRYKQLRQHRKHIWQRQRI